jgi:uncharacterized membrane protein YhaH (DUF805 family)
MNELFLDFNGRIPRKIYIVSFFFLFCLQVGASYILLQLVGLTLEEYMQKVSRKTLTFDFVSNGLFLWPNLAIGVKRLHDFAWSGRLFVIVHGALMLVYLIAILGAFGETPGQSANFWGVVRVLGLASFVFFVAMLFVRGTDGNNQYGRDPQLYLR